MKRYKVKKGYVEVGKECISIGETQEFGGRKWTPVIFDGYENPEWYKTESLELIPAPLPEQTKEFQWTDKDVLEFIAGYFSIQPSADKKRFIEQNIVAYKNSISIAQNAPDNKSSHTAPAPVIQEGKPILFTTEDGKDMREGEIYWMVDLADWSVSYSGAAWEGSGRYTERKYFSTESNAKDYVLNFKPFPITLRELTEIKRTIADGAKGHDTKNYLNNIFRELAKSKTNQ